MAYKMDIFGYPITLFDESRDIIPRGVNNQLRGILSGAPVIGGIIRSEDNWNYYNDYLNNRGMSWDDVRYPARSISGLGGFYGGISYISRNIVHLYD